MERIESELSLQPREDAVLLIVTKESNAHGLKVIREGGRQMVLLKMESAGRGSRTSLNVDPQCQGQVELSLRRKGQKGHFSKRQMLREAEEMLVHVAKPRKSNHLNTWLGMEARKSRKRSRK